MRIIVPVHLVCSSADRPRIMSETHWQTCRIQRTRNHQAVHPDTSCLGIRSLLLSFPSHQPRHHRSGPRSTGLLTAHRLTGQDSSSHIPE
ncbi:hypothetical protein CALCODRAFT_34145 [Calocera cornea HHB12733]|uniref:Uncharacterized protein n=1 Tax=Calocera cornea HHB12733 TaxID=1353952 RepID=A0A165E186_9BASI|nr:hypothetical protein CALCODRAFT_34145 [Calocera cornea HHB12733]